MAGEENSEVLFHDGRDLPRDSVPHCRSAAFLKLVGQKPLCTRLGQFAEDQPLAGLGTRAGVAFGGVDLSERFLCLLS